MKTDPKTRSSRRVAFASFVGTTMEWYDFYLFGIASALIFNKVFFPEFLPLLGVMASYAVYGVGFFARPLGALIFGHFGDKVGRKQMLVTTLSMMGLSTFLIGLLPTYYEVGIIAPILLVVLRLIQGLAVGGEWGGAAVIAAEHSRDTERGYYSSWPNAGAPFGLTLSILIFLIFSSMPDEEFFSWGWRVPFLLGIIPAFLGMMVRRRILESPVFSKAQQRETMAEVPALEIARTSKKNFILAMGSRFAESGSFYIFTVFILSYGTQQLYLEKNWILYGVFAASVIETFAIPFFGHLSDKIGRRPVYLMGAVLVGVFAFPFFWMFQTKSIPLIWLALIIGISIGHAAMHGPQAAFITEMFKTRMRYSGVSIAYHLAAAFSGGLAPLIATALISWSHGEPWPVAVYIILLALISVVSIYLATETANKDITK